MTAKQGARAAGFFIVTVAVVLMVMLRPHKGKAQSQQITTPKSSTKPSATATRTPNPFKPSLPAHIDKYPTLTKSVTLFVQLYYSRPVGETPQAHKALLAAHGVATAHFLQEMALDAPPADQMLDGENVQVISEVVPGSISGELSNNTTASESYMVYSYQLTSGGKPQYPSQSLEHATWKLVDNHWLVDSLET